MVDNLQLFNLIDRMRPITLKDRMRSISLLYFKIMNKKKITIISILITTNVLTAIAALIFYIGMKIGIGGIIEEENHHLSLKVEKLKNHILSENEGLTIAQFMKKHNIEKEREKFEIESNLVGHNLLYFEFKDGVLNDIE